MSVHKKLMQARVKLQAREIKKSGHNDFSGYHYFELGDFLPHIQSIFAEVGLCGVVSFSRDYAELSITDVEDGTMLTISSPMAAAELKGAHPIQQMGAIQTYQRRYLWMAALEIVEHDVLDATQGADTKAAPTPAPKAAPAKPATPARAFSAALTVPEGVTNWAQAVIDATHIVLDLAQSADDVMDVFKKNRTVYDRLKTEDTGAYDTLMQLFKTMKESLK
jgi:hypothetical protein